MSHHSLGIEPRSRRGPSWSTDKTLRRSGLGIVVCFARGEGTSKGAPKVKEVLVDGRMGAEGGRI